MIQRRDIKNILILLFFSILIFTLLNLKFHFYNFPKYGDFGSLDVYIAQSRPFTRWFLGSTLILDIYWKIWKYFDSFSYLQNIRFVPLLSALIINISTIIFIKKFGPKLFLIFPILSSFWIMFSLGYDEYYPFIAPLYLFILLWLFVVKKQYNHKTYLLGGFLAALLPLFYIGFTPLGIIILIFLTVKNYRLAPIAYFIFIFTILLTINRFWPWGIADFYKDLTSHLNFGDNHTEYIRYLGKSAGPQSINFKLDYIFSIEHFQDLFYMAFWGGGLINLLLLVGGIIIYFKKFSIHFKKLFIKSIFLLGCAILIQQTYYFLFMIPKMGPLKDIDLFFSVYITWGFFAGLLWEKIFTKITFKKFQISIIFLYCLSTIISLYFLLIKGLPFI